jgi:hypothetical protein
MSNRYEIDRISGNISVTKGAICVELTVGSRSLPTTFFVVDAKGTYSLLL